MRATLSKRRNMRGKRIITEDCALRTDLYIIEVTQSAKKKRMAICRLGMPNESTRIGLERTSDLRLMNRFMIAVHNGY